MANHEVLLFKLSSVLLCIFSEFAPDLENFLRVLMARSFLVFMRILIFIQLYSSAKTGQSIFPASVITAGCGALTKVFVDLVPLEY